MVGVLGFGRYDYFWHNWTVNEVISLMFLLCFLFYWYGKSFEETGHRWNSQFPFPFLLSFWFPSTSIMVVPVWKNEVKNWIWRWWYWEKEKKFLFYYSSEFVVAFESNFTVMGLWRTIWFKEFAYFNKMEFGVSKGSVACKRFQQVMLWGRSTRVSYSLQPIFQVNSVQR